MRVNLITFSAGDDNLGPTRKNFQTVKTQPVSPLASKSTLCYIHARITSDPQGSGNRTGDGARDSG